jgi:deoxyribonuclease IV
MPRFGAHESIAGGLYLAFDRICQVGGQSLQLFTRNQRQWQPPPLSDAEVAAFIRAWDACDRMPVISHASYLINLASQDKEKQARSVLALRQELQRCHRLGIPQVVLHPGNHLGAGIEAGLAAVVASLDAVLEGIDGPRILLETTAGQGSSLGASFPELAFIRQQSRFADRLGICLDTCHVHAAGYPLDSAAGYGATIKAFEREIGLEHLQAIHVNDSQRSCGSRVDRHAHIGQGQIGLAGFRCLVNDPRLGHLPMILETDKGPDLEEDRHNLATLRGLLNTRPS